MNTEIAGKWVGKYGYFDFNDNRGIKDVSHLILSDLIDKCEELEERITKVEEEKLRKSVENLAKTEKTKVMPKKKLKPKNGG